MIRSAINKNAGSNIGNTLGGGAVLRVNPNWARLPLFDRKGLTKARFGDVVENLNETERNPVEARLERFIGLEHLEPGSLHIRAWGNVVDGTTFTRRCRPGQVLFGKRRAYQRKVAVAEFDAVVSGDIYVLTPKNDRLLPEFLPFLCLSERFFQHAVGTSAGSLSPRTNWSSLAGFEFDLPPLDQQRRIAEILWAVDEMLEFWRDSVHYFDLYYHNVSKTLLRKDSQQNATRIKSSSWRKCTFGDAATLQRGHDLPVPERVDGDIPIWGSNGICGFHSEAMYDGPGVITGRSGTIGEVYYTGKPFWPLNTTLFVKDFHGNNPKYIYYLLKSFDFKKFSAGSAVPTLNRNDVHPTPIQIPELRDQLRIVEALDKFVSYSESLRGHIGKCSEMMKMLVEMLLEVQSKCPSPNPTPSSR